MKRNKAKDPGLLQDLAKAGRNDVISCAVLSMFINVLALTLPLYMMQIFSHILVSESVQSLIMITVIGLVAVITWGILSEVRGRILRLLGEKIDLLLGDRVHKAMIAHAIKTNDTRTVSGLRDLATLRNSAASQQTAALFDVPWSPLFLGLIYVLSPALGTFAIAGAALQIVLAWLNDRLIREPQSQASAAAEAELTFALASVRNAEVVEGMGMRSAVVERWQRQHLDALAHQARASLLGGVIANISRSIRMILQIAIFAVGAYLVITGEIGTGVMMASVYLLSRGLAPVDTAIGTWRQMMSAHAAYSRLGKLLDSERERPYGLKLPRPTGQLSVHNLVFGRPGSPPVLKGVSFSVASGDLVGIVGPSAAGKSTLAKLIVGVWRPTSGMVRLDGADVANWDPDELGRYVGYLPQEVELFAGTVRDNIARLGNATDEDIVAAAQLAGAHDIILKLSKGYDSDIGEAGSVLSGGQRQRIGLARALFRGPSLIVLDEPNANLDGPGEEALVGALKRARSFGSTVILITHKPALLFAVDKILVLNDGIVDSFGDRNEILRKIAPSPEKRRLANVASGKELRSQPAEAASP